MSNPYRNYQKTQVVTASREKILLMLYEGAIRFTKQAASAMEEKRVADKGKYISKATAIISELMATLDFRVGGQLAMDLENLYVFMIDRLIQANIENKPEYLKNVEELLMTLYVAWKDVIENPRPDGVPSPKLQPNEYQNYVQSGQDSSASANSNTNNQVNSTLPVRPVPKNNDEQNMSAASNAITAAANVNLSKASNETNASVNQKNTKV